MDDAAHLLLGPMLRFVDDTSATIWVEADRACEVTVRRADDQVPLAATHTFRVHGHHYALAVVEGLEPGSTTAYEVELDHRTVWPEPDATSPPSLVRTTGGTGPVTLVFGSCRAAAPHEPPFTSRLDDDARGKGVDALRALGLRMRTEDPGTWPQLLLLAGDQVYADESSPSTSRRIERRRELAATRGHDAPTEAIPDGVVADFEEYTWLYRESWSPEIERWLFSTVPSAMIFDDHDMIDDWNISASWVRDIRGTSWWSEHVIGGLVSYWVHQHLGNLSPARLRDEGLLARCLEVDDATELLGAWAMSSEEFTPLPGGYRFTFERHLGGLHLVVMDVRNGRVLEPGARQILDDGEWAWVRECALEPSDHLVLASSLPVFVPGGLHGIQQWNEAVCDGAWGRPAAWVGERMRRALDLEGWPAFDRSFAAMEALLLEVAGRDGAPHTISIVGGDIHFGYVAEIALPDGARSTVRQVVCSPLRNILRTRDRRVMRFGASRSGRRVGAWLQRAVGRGRTALRWELEDGPVFDNNIGTFHVDGPELGITIEVATLDEDGRQVLRPAVRLDLDADRTEGQPGTARANRTTVPSS